MYNTFICELLKKGKRFAVSYIVSESQTNEEPEKSGLLQHVAEYLLNPKEDLNKPDIIEWVKWLVSAGQSPEDFTRAVIKHDTTTTCGLVWVANFVAYRCRTCAISPCMSLCAECFQKGDHEGHDFNMFRSLAGGACDCGDESVMKKSGFCCKHSEENKFEEMEVLPTTSSDESEFDDSKENVFRLLFVARSLMPKILNRLLVELRRNDKKVMPEIDLYLVSLLDPLIAMGGPMRNIIAKSLIDKNFYQHYAKNCETISGLEVKNFLLERYRCYMEAKLAMPNLNLKVNYKDCTLCPPGNCTLKLDNEDFNHSSFVEEFFFWTVQYEFPQKLVCFLLNMLPDLEYKQAFAKSFVHHYSRTAKMLANFRINEDASTTNTNKPSAHDILSNCVVHVSVQLLSNESLAFKLCEEEHTLFIIIASLREIIEGPDSKNSNLTQSLLQDPWKNNHKVVKCDHYVMKKHFYWPLVSDLNNILTHKRVSLMLIKNKELFELWLEFILKFQGMNLNVKELLTHVEYENDSYYASFSSELEICATPLWTIISFNKDKTTADLTKKVISSSLNFLNIWFKLIGFEYDMIPNPNHCTFHIPLHRYYSIFLRNGVEFQGLSLDELLPSSEEQIKLLLAHPLQIQINFYEILCSLWVRNGLQMKGQSMTYIQCHFSNSMIDPDLFLIQQLASKLSPDWFIKTVLQRFHVFDWLSFKKTPEKFNLYDSFYVKKNKNGFLENEQLMPMLENTLTFLCTLFTIQTNLGLSEQEVIRKEMVALLCMSDRTYSQLHDVLPEKCGTLTDPKSFDKTLSDIADFRSPSLEPGGNLTQGMYFPKPEIWLNEYDPLYVLLRAVHRRDYQSSIDRFTQFIKNTNSSNKIDSENSKESKENTKNQLWPPFRLPNPINSKYSDPKKLLYSKVLQGLIFTILYRALHTNEISEQVLAMTIFLLQLCLTNNKPEINSPAVQLNYVKFSEKELKDLAFEDWFKSNWILENMNVVIQNIVVEEKKEDFQNSCVLLGDKIFDDRRNDNLGDQSLTVEEMEFDFIYPNEDNENYIDDEYMNDTESSPREYIERIEEMPQLPCSNIPLALTSGNSSSMEESVQPISLVKLTEPNIVSEEGSIISTSSSSPSNSLSCPSSAPMLAISNTSSSNFSEVTENTSNQPTNTQTSKAEEGSSLIKNSIRTLKSPNSNSNNLNSLRFHKRRNFRLNSLSIQNLGQIRENQQQASSQNMNHISVLPGPSTSPLTRLVFQGNNKNNYQPSSLCLSNIKKTALAELMAPTNQNERAISPVPSTSKDVSLSIFQRVHRQMLKHRRFNSSKSDIHFNQDNQMNICEIINALPSNSGNMITDKKVVNESIISLLLKLHSKLNGKLDSYKLSDDRHLDVTNRIGDASHFIEQVLDLYCNLNVSTGKEAILKWKTRLWPQNYMSEFENEKINIETQKNFDTKQSCDSIDSKFSANEPSQNSLEKDERKRKAKERQKKLMADFANRQKAFMKQMNKEFSTSNHEQKTQENKNKMTIDVCDKLQYECVICGQTTASTTERLIGMVVLLQSSSVLAHCRPKYPLETLKETRSLKETEKVHEGRINLIDEATILLNQKQTLGNYMEERIDSFDQNFDKSSWFNAINIGWEGGVHVQSCGHYLHLDCHCSYMQSLKANRSKNRNNVENCEFSCPFCRQMANSVLPINPDINKKADLSSYLKTEQFNLKKSDFSSVNRPVAEFFQQSNEDLFELSYFPVSEEKNNSIEISDSECTVDSVPNNSNIQATCSKKSLIRDTSLELIHLYTKIPLQDRNLLTMFRLFCEDLTKATSPQYRSIKTTPTTHSLYLFLCSILRTNLEAEILVKISNSKPAGSKKPCFVPLFNVLALSCHFLIPYYYTSMWSQITGLSVPETLKETVISIEKEVPLLLIDTSAILIQLLFALPLNVDEKYFDSIVQNLYNLTVIQALGQITCFFTEKERSKMMKGSNDNITDSISNLLNYIINFFEKNNPNLYSSMDDDDNDIYLKSWKSSEIQNLAINMCLPFVRLSALLKCYLYNRDYPSLKNLTEEQFKETEYFVLARLLNLKSNSENLITNDKRFYMPHFICDNSNLLLNTWLNQYSLFLDKSFLVASKLLHCKPIHFINPKLLSLPATYDQLFLHYYQKPCSQCNTCPKEPCICLLCASLVCMRQECCRLSDSLPLEAVYHSQNCGAGTALYLAVHSSTVIVIRGRRACVWGSVYLDSHGEEDRDLKRGRPLYLSELRYNVLEQQWLTHSFDHTSKRWVWHKDVL